MAKLETLSLTDLYSRKITASVEAAIMLKEDFSKKAPDWCNKVCRLSCKNPPVRNIVSTDQVDVLIIQDYSAFDEPRFRKSGSVVENSHRTVIDQLAVNAFKATDDHSKLTYSVTNLLKCGLQGGDIKKGKAPTDTVIMKCRPYLLKEIELRKPKVIISLNTSVTKAMGLKKTNYGNRGEIFNNVVFTLHPRTLLMLRQNSSGKFWGPDFYDIIQRDFHKAAALARGQLRNPDLLGSIAKHKRQIKTAKSIEDVIAFTTELQAAGEEGRIISYDTETNTLDPFAVDAKILTMQFGYRNSETGFIHVFVFPMWHRENNFYDPVEAFDYIRPILEDSRIPKVGHHMKFDVLMTYTVTRRFTGDPCRIVNVAYDTMLLLHAKDSGTQGNLGLKQAVWDYLPDLELGGYEDMLPSLHTAKQIEKLEGEENGDDNSDE
jgi:hypothetical protein